MNNCDINFIEYKKNKIQYDSILEEIKKWESSLRNKFSFGDTILINGMLAYLQNKDNGFSAYNDEDIHQSLRSSDDNNVLYNEAKYGADLYKQLCMIGDIVWKRSESNSH